MANIFVLAANLLPLAGVWLWGWDAFLVLMVYWAETVIVAGWTLARIATMPDQNATAGVTSRGHLLVNLGKTIFFAVHAGMFITVHLVFLLALFSGEWGSRTNGTLAFLHALFIETGAWVALVFAFVAGLIGFVTATPQPTVVTWALRRLDLVRLIPAARPSKSDEDHTGPVVSALYTRIIVMQFGIIFGAWVAALFGSKAPLVIVIVLKTLIELRGWVPFNFAMNDKAARGDETAQRHEQK